VPNAHLVLIAANLVYATAPSVTRLTLQHIGPATLAFAELVIASVILVPLTLTCGVRGHSMSRADWWKLVTMGVVGFAAAFSLTNWGIRLSGASDAALLVTIEPASLIVLSPLVLGEHLTRRERLGAVVTLVGATMIVVNGIPGVTAALAPRWQGDLLLVLAPVAYASYTLIGRGLLSRYASLPVTAWSILWGAVGMLPLAAVEYVTGQPPRWTLAAIGGLLYLAVVVVTLGFMGWNYALERVEAPRAAIFLNLQPLAGALLGVFWLGEPLTSFTVMGGLLILGGLHVAAQAAASRSTATVPRKPGD
jgi:drug/metabolite transporter (DMT)-like permease